MPNLGSYPAYVEIEAPWIKHAPEHWASTRVKYFLQEVDQRSTSGDETLLSMRQLRGLIPHNEVSEKEFSPEDLIGYKKVRSGQLVMNRMRASIGLFAAAKQDGLVSPDYAVFDVAQNVNVDYLVNLFQTKEMGEKFRVESKGLGTGSSGFLRLYTDRFGPIQIVLPSEQEQDKIVLYIANLGRIFQHLVATKRRCIELLQHQKRAIIQKGVTGGYSRSTAFRNSGVSYLKDEIPQEWLTKPLKHCAKINRASLPETTDEDYEFNYIEIGAVSTGILVEQPTRIRYGTAPSRARRIVQKGDTIISTVRTYLKAVYFISEDMPDLVASTGFAVLSPKDFIEPEFLSYAVQSNYFVDCVTANSVGVAYPAIAETKLAAFKIVAPPSLEEQKEIVAEIKKETFELDKGIDRSRKQIELIREYHRRLVSDVVTGKLDIRNLESSMFDISDSGSDLGESELLAEELTTEGAVDGED